MKKTIVILILMICYLASFAQETGTFTDTRDKKVYKTVKIGAQTWMAENLDASTFRNGDTIPNGMLMSEKNFKKLFKHKKPTCITGEKNKIYSLYTVKDSRGLAPQGWHIPTEKEWIILNTFLGKDASLKMKSTNGWKGYSINPTNAPGIIAEANGLMIKVENGNGTNESGFNGFSENYGSPHVSEYYFESGTNACWWGLSLNPVDVYFKIEGNSADLNEYYGNYYWFSVRCIKD